MIENRSVFPFILCGLLAISRLLFADNIDATSNVEIEILISDESGSESIQFCFKSDREFNKLFKVDQSELGSSNTVTRKVYVTRGPSELMVVVGKLSYVFDVEAVEGVKYAFVKEGNGLLFSTSIESVKPSAVEKVEAEEVLLLLTGELKGQRITLSIDSVVIFSDELNVDKIPFYKVVRFSVSESSFNLRAVVSGTSYAFDVDLEDGRYLYFDKFKNNTIIIKQYKAEDQLPDLL